MATRIVPQAECPRCGYDLSGAVTSWRDRCPVGGMCPECGLDYRWRDVLDPGYAMPRWFIEHPHTGFLRGFVKTSVRSFSGRRFWSSIWLSHPVNSRRLIGFLLAWCLGVYALLQFLTTVGTERDFASDLEAMLVGELYGYALVFNPVTVISQQFGWYYENKVSHDWLMMVSLWMLLMPLAFCSLIHTRRIARVRLLHLFRAWVYFLPTVLMVVMIDCVLRIGWLHRGDWNAPTAFERQLWDIFFDFEGPILFLVTLRLLQWWWGAAISKYLRLAQPRATLLIIMVISGLAALAIEETLSGSALFSEMLQRLKLT